jgi:hypothetical protein
VDRIKGRETGKRRARKEKEGSKTGKRVDRRRKNEISPRWEGRGKGRKEERKRQNTSFFLSLKKKFKYFC